MAKTRRHWLRYRCYLSFTAAVKRCVFSLLHPTSLHLQQ